MGQAFIIHRGGGSVNLKNVKAVLNWSSNDTTFHYYPAGASSQTSIEVWRGGSFDLGYIDSTKKFASNINDDLVGNGILNSLVVKNGVLYLSNSALG